MPTRPGSELRAHSLTSKAPDLAGVFAQDLVRAADVRSAEDAVLADDFDDFGQLLSDSGGPTSSWRAATVAVDRRRLSS